MRRTVITKRQWPIALLGLIAGLVLAVPALAAPYVYVSASDGTMRTIDTESNSEVAKVEGIYGGAVPIAVHPSESLAYAGKYDEIQVIDTLTNVINGEIALDPASSNVRAKDMVTSPDGKYLYVIHTEGGASGNAMVTKIDTVNDTVVATLSLNSNLHGVLNIVVHPSGNSLYIAHPGPPNSAPESYVSVIDTASLTLTALVPIETLKSIVSVIDAVGEYVYIFGYSGIQSWVAVIDTQTNVKIEEKRYNFSYVSVNDAVAHPTSDNLYLLGGNSIKIFDTATLTVSSPIDLTSFHNATRLAIEPTGRYVYIYGLTYSYDSGDHIFASELRKMDTTTNSLDPEVFTLTGAGTILPGDIVIGPLLEPVGGAATGITAISVTCTNSTSGQSVSIGLGNEKTWDCESSGLQVNSGDSIEMVVTGNAD